MFTCLFVDLVFHAIRLTVVMVIYLDFIHCQIYDIKIYSVLKSFCILETFCVFVSG